jgi:hypothetical protein
MRTTIMLAGLAALLIAGCDDPDNAADANTPAQTQPAGDASTRAQDALGQAGTAARETLQNLGEAGAAGLESLQENAPAIQEGLSNAGDRLKDAAGNIINDVNPPDAPGDSEADPNQTPERSEPAQ